MYRSTNPINFAHLLGMLTRLSNTLPPIHQLQIPFPASMDRQMLLPKGGEPEPSSVPMVFQPSLCAEA